jgi:hypothetical protein
MKRFSLVFSLLVGILAAGCGQSSSSLQGRYEAAGQSVYSAIELLPDNVAKIYSPILPSAYTTTYDRKSNFIFIKSDRGDLSYEIVDGNTLKGPGGGFMGAEAVEYKRPALAKSERIGTIADIEGDNADTLLWTIRIMMNSQKDNNPTYEELTAPFKNSVKFYTSRKGSVIASLDFPWAIMGSVGPGKQAYDNAFAYAFSQGLSKMEEGTPFLIVSVNQPDGKTYNYSFPKSLVAAILSDSIERADMEKQVFVGTGSAMNE